MTQHIDHPHGPSTGSPTDKPEWLRPKDATKYFGIGRTKLFEWIASGRIKTVSLRERGQKRATRLIHYDSLAAYLDQLASQNLEA